MIYQDNWQIFCLLAMEYICMAEVPSDSHWIDADYIYLMHAD